MALLLRSSSLWQLFVVVVIVAVSFHSSASLLLFSFTYPTHSSTPPNLYIICIYSYSLQPIHIRSYMVHTIILTCFFFILLCLQKRPLPKYTIRICGDRVL